MHGRNDYKDDLPSTSKRYKARGKLHTWTYRSKIENMTFWRCLVCDYIDMSLWPYTPEPKEPCPND